MCETEAVVARSEHTHRGRGRRDVSTHPNPPHGSDNVHLARGSADLKTSNELYKKGGGVEDVKCSHLSPPDTPHRLGTLPFYSEKGGGGYSLWP